MRIERVHEVNREFRTAAHIPASQVSFVRPHRNVQFRHSFNRKKPWEFPLSNLSISEDVTTQQLMKVKGGAPAIAGTLVSVAAGSTWLHYYLRKIGEDDLRARGVCSHWAARKYTDCPAGMARL